MLPKLPTVAKRFVDDAVVLKKLVVVAADPVALMKVKFWSVLDPVAKRLVVVAKVKRAEVAWKRQIGRAHV